MFGIPLKIGMLLKTSLSLISFFNRVCDHITKGRNNRWGVDVGGEHERRWCVQTNEQMYIDA